VSKRLSKRSQSNAPFIANSIKQFINGTQLIYMMDMLQDLSDNELGHQLYNVALLSVNYCVPMCSCMETLKLAGLYELKCRCLYYSSSILDILMFTPQVVSRKCDFSLCVNSVCPVINLLSIFLSFKSFPHPSHLFVFLIIS
jgi:hypothetical protein